LRIPLYSPRLPSRKSQRPERTRARHQYTFSMVIQNVFCLATTTAHLSWLANRPAGATNNRPRHQPPLGRCTHFANERSAVPTIPPMTCQPRQLSCGLSLDVQISQKAARKAATRDYQKHSSDGLCRAGGYR